MTEPKRKLHNLRCFIKWNPSATVSDFAKSVSDGKNIVRTVGLAYNGRG